MQPNRKLLPVEKIIKLVSYDETSGFLTWLPREASDFSDGKYKADRKALSWNAQYAGRKVGNIDLSTGYKRTNILGVTYKCHQLAWIVFYKQIPSGDIDHINGDRSDNRIRNLRLASKSMNARNTQRHRDGLAGVVWDKPVQKWRAQIWSKGKNVCLGFSSCIAQAHIIRHFGEMRHWGDR